MSDPWKETEDFVTRFQNGDYFETKYRALVYVDGRPYPCWIGPKKGKPNCAGAILITRDGESLPEGDDHTRPVDISSGPVNGWRCWQFRNAVGRANEGYGEMRRYLWHWKDEKVSVFILEKKLTGKDIAADAIANALKIS